MIDLNELTDELTSDEKSRRTVYDDATGEPIHPGSICHGHPTIGVGRALDVHGLSDDEIKLLLHNDAIEVTDHLVETLPWLDSMNGPRQVALANMSFNLGLTGLLGFHQTLSLLEAGNYDAAAIALLASKWAKQVGARSKRIAEQIRTGVRAPR